MKPKYPIPRSQMHKIIVNRSEFREQTRRTFVVVFKYTVYFTVYSLRIFYQMQE